jgi:nucleotide-binding universal stress UspA family protein
MADPTRILVCHDGSEGSDEALDLTARLFPGARATLAHVWTQPMPYGGIAYGGQVILPNEIRQEIERKALEQIEEVTAQAVARATAAGLTADADVRTTKQPVWRELLSAADEAGADLIVAGSRGFGEVRGLLLGSTSQALVHHAQRPVLIVPAQSRQA